VLLAHGAAIERRDLKYAILEGQVQIVGWLIDAGADPRWTFDDGLTVIEEAARSPKNVRSKMVALIRTFMGTERAAPK
jgi:hypothetical protein